MFEAGTAIAYRVAAFRENADATTAEC